ncbi:hypothetical protein ACIOWB_24005 [Pseudomonas capeferrum]|uniref:hypothetical protein n=1 Tax=Pseudomonas capeferrum TaxID=1495066 RepID=UPI00381ABB81
MQQNYILTIRDLFLMNKDDQHGAETQVAILDNGVEVDRVHFRGKCDQYQRLYTGKPGLSATIASGPGTITMASALFV